MTTITLWLLVSVGYPVGQAATQTVERFRTEEDCQRVLVALSPGAQRPALRCVPAVILRP